MTSSSGFLTGNWRSMSWSIRVKMAVLAPMPRAKDRIATEANRGLRRIARRAKRTSGVRLLIQNYTNETGFRKAEKRRGRTPSDLNRHRGEQGTAANRAQGEADVRREAAHTELYERDRLS